MGFSDEFKKFLLYGDLVTLAVAFVVGLAIVALIGALVADIINPLIGAAVHIDFSQLGVFTVNGSTFRAGALLGSLINFIVLMIVIFFIIVYPYQKYQARKKAREAAAAPTTRECPACCNQIPVKASRCGFCTSAVTPITEKLSTGIA